MKKLLSTTIAALSIAMVSQADFSQFADATGYASVFDNNAGAAGGYLWGPNGEFQILELMLVLMLGLDNISKPKSVGCW